MDLRLLDKIEVCKELSAIQCFIYENCVNWKPARLKNKGKGKMENISSTTNNKIRKSS